MSDSKRCDRCGAPLEDVNGQQLCRSCGVVSREPILSTAQDIGPDGLHESGTWVGSGMPGGKKLVEKLRFFLSKLSVGERYMHQVRSDVLRKFHGQKWTETARSDLLIVCAILVTSRKQHIPLSLRTIEKATGFTQKEIHRGIRDWFMEDQVGIVSPKTIISQGISRIKQDESMKGVGEDTFRQFEQVAIGLFVWGDESGVWHGRKQAVIASCCLECAAKILDIPMQRSHVLGHMECSECSLKRVMKEFRDKFVSLANKLPWADVMGPFDGRSVWKQGIDVLRYGKWLKEGPEDQTSHDAVHEKSNPESESDEEDVDHT